jgi:hypothetical protein
MLRAGGMVRGGHGVAKGRGIKAESTSSNQYFDPGASRISPIVSIAESRQKEVPDEITAGARTKGWTRPVAEELACPDVPS